MKKIILFLVLLTNTAHAADRLTCQTAGIVTKCPADASLAAGSVLQTAFVPWSAAPAGSIPNSALVTTPPALSSGTPSAIGTAAPGVGIAASRFDHVHALPSVGSAGTYAYPISITTDAQGRATGITAGSAPQASSADLTALASFGLGLGIPVRTATTPTWSISTTLSNANALEITGQVGEAGGTGDITLCRWFPELGKWRLWAEYAPMKATVSGGTFSGRYQIAYTGPTYWRLVSPTVTVESAHGEGVVYDAR